MPLPFARLPFVGLVTAPVTAIADRLPAAVPMPGRRLIWREGGRTLIEARGIAAPEADELRLRLHHALTDIQGVHWAEVNALTGRVAVDFDTSQTRLGDLVRAVRDVEPDGDAGAGTQTPTLPSDPAPGQRALLALAADVMGLWVSVIGRIVRLAPVPIELASLVSLVENQPRLRRVVERRLGAEVTDVLLGVTSALANGIAQGPLGLVVDIAHRSGQFTEARAAQHAWDTAQRELYANPRPKPVAPAEVDERPVPLPQGPVEVWSDRISAGGAVAAAATFAGTGDLRRGADALLAGMPKAARLGREAFAAQLGRSLAARGVVVLQPQALRRLDRLDTVMIDSAGLMTDRWDVTGAWAAKGYGADDVHRRAVELLEGSTPDRARTIRGWSLRPYTAEQALPRGAKTNAAKLRRGATVLGVHRADALVGLVSVTAEVEPGAHILADAIRSSGHRLVLAGQEGSIGTTLGADDVVARRGLAARVRDLQRNGAVVAVISRRGKAALAAADIGIGLTRRRSGRPPWAADILCGTDLREAAHIIDASVVAAHVSRRSARIALAGSSAGAMLAVTGPRRRAGRRTLTAVNSAALISIGTATWDGRTLARRPRPVLPDLTPWHALEVGDVLERLDARERGLSTDQARQRLRAPGGTQAEPSTIEPFLEELANPLTPILGGGAALSALVGSAVDAALVGGLIGINTLIGGAQRLHTDRAVAELLRSSAQDVVVRRDGISVIVPSDELVVGDVIELSSGDAVPADCRIMTAESLEVDESSLTGESLPVAKTAAATAAATTADRTSMIFEGTSLAAGSAVGLVVATGTSTQAGSALSDAALGAPRSGGVEERLSALTRQILPVAAVAAGGVTLAGFLRRWTTRDIVGSAVNLAVASVPEGLPFLATGAQVAAARRLAQRGALIRTSRAMEAIGRVDVLCFDKTGTLTEGRIRVAQICDGLTSETVDALGHWHRDVLAAALRASPASEAEAADHATDAAVLAAGDEAGVDGGTGEGGWERLNDLPFEPARGLSAGLSQSDVGARLSVKGAPEVVLERCVTWRRANGTVALDDDHRALLEAKVDRLARHGYRLLAVAERGATDRVELDEERVDQLEFLGLLALSDPIRESAAEAVSVLGDAGVSIVMVTGDHPSTAEAIAADLGILNGGRVVTGAELDAADDTALSRLLEKTSVFARVTPAQKVRIVQAYQRAGHSVAMTGDGANDAPSIRLADVGVALGQRGTTAARQAADLVVTDDRLETLIDAIIEGRAMWSSVRDALAVLVGGNLGEIGFTLGASLFSRQPPMNARQFLLVNLLTDLAPAMVIAMQPPPDRDTESLLQEGPEQSLGEALNRAIAIRAVATGAAATGAWGAARLTGTPGRASTVAMLALVGTQLGQTLTSGRGNRAVAVTGLGSLAVLAAIVQTPGVSHFFGCRPVGPLGWAQAATASTIATTAAARAARRTPGDRLRPERAV